jgi:hypothetical protein
MNTNTTKLEGLNTITYNNLTPENIVLMYYKNNRAPVILNDTNNTKWYFTVIGHVNLSLMGKTETMVEPIEIYWMSDH